jgi:hypothetical protein
MTKAAESATTSVLSDSTVTTPSKTSSGSTDPTPATSLSSRRRRDRSKGPTPPRRTASVKALLVELERLQHRAVMLDQLAQAVCDLFGTEHADHPKYLIGVEGGTAVPARPEVMSALEMELLRSADITRAQIRRRLETMMTVPVEEPAAPISEGIPPAECVACEEGDDELSSMLVRSVSNPRAGRSR